MLRRVCESIAMNTREILGAFAQIQPMQALAAAAEAEIPSCPMEGFEPKKVWDILEPGADYWPVALLAVGHTVAGDDG
ncbi:MAG: hypothetical protein ACO27G_05340, partial [Bacteroidia bacterium]